LLSNTSRDTLISSRKRACPPQLKIARGDPTPVIAKTAEKIGADLILFGTHGHAGLEAFWKRSVAASVASPD